MIEFDIKSLVPKFIMNDRNGYAIAKAIESAMKTFCRVCAEGIACVNDPQKMPEWRLDEMAWEIGAAWYDSSADIESKRRQISDAAAVLRTIGTKAAVLSAIESIFGEGYITEWYQYSGGAYHYKISAGNADDVNSKQAEFLRVIGIVQNARSVLDGIEYSGIETSMNAAGATGAVSGLIRMETSAAEYAGSSRLGEFILGTGTLA